MPKVSALMPLYNGRQFIQESLESIQKQTFTDWEFIIVNDFGSDDGCAEIIRKYAEKDPRIILVQAEERLGLAASLNVGLDLVKGEYIARVDVDDPSAPERFEKQVAFMDTHPSVSVCSCFCTSLSKNGTHTEKVACEPEELKAAMLFPNEIRHFGTMLRKSFFDTHGLRYDPDYIVEDYELWTRAIMKGAVLANIPESLVTHRWGFGNVSIAKGSKLEEEARMISARMLKSIGVSCDKYPPELLSGWRAYQRKFAQADVTLFLQKGYQLLSEIFEKNKTLGYCDPQALHKILFYRWNWIRKSCGLNYTEHKYEDFKEIATTPVVSVVLPTFCSVRDVSRAIDSIQAQTYTDWELLVINDAGSDDGTAEIVEMYAWNDPRIRLIQAKDRLGLAESLNLGMREARGKYIARLDADDTSVPKRLEKQVAFLEAHPKVGICGGWQHHYGKDCDWIHKAAPDPKTQRCRLLFWCDLCHSTLMLRRDVFIKNDLFYDSNAQAEDFELWTRAMEFMEIANIPEVLGDYREGSGITTNKINSLAAESGKITIRTIKHFLNVDLPASNYYLLNGWINPLDIAEDREESLDQLKKILTEIWNNNKIVYFFDEKELLKVLAAKWHWVKDGIDWESNDYKRIKKIEDVFSDKCRPSLFARYRSFKGKNPKLSVRIKKLVKRVFLRPLAKFGRRIVKSLFSDMDKSIERWTWERFQRMDRLMKQSFPNHYTPYYNDEKIRVVFLFQVASFWPGQESLYHVLCKDDRFDVKLICYDEPYDKTIKTETSRKFLKNNNYVFTPWEQFNLADFNPHIAFLQTAYDSNRRVEYKSMTLFLQGIRVIYIPYGIEIADTEHAHKDHFRNYVVGNTWKIYTGSEMTRREYLRYLRQRKDVCALGLPRFDALFHREAFGQLKEIEQRACNRKIILWKVHFPKVIKEKSETVMVTPYIKEYIAFAKRLDQYEDLFFVFMPHPRFKEFNEDQGVRRELMQLLSLVASANNAYIDDSDDYRNSLLNADCIIVDRSAVMVEAGSVGVPVLYMYNPDYNEPLARSIKPLIDSYYQGTRCADMENFLEMFRNGEDPQKTQREYAFHQCIPYFDGQCSERIKEDIVQSLMREDDPNTEQCLLEKYEELALRVEKMEETLANL